MAGARLIRDRADQGPESDPTERERRRPRERLGVGQDALDARGVLVEAMDRAAEQLVHAQSERLADGGAEVPERLVRLAVPVDQCQVQTRDEAVGVQTVQRRAQRVQLVGEQLLQRHRPSPARCADRQDRHVCCPSPGRTVWSALQSAVRSHLEGFGPDEDHVTTHEAARAAGGRHDEPLPTSISALDDWRRRDRVRTQAAAGVAIVGVVGILSAVSAPLYRRLAVVLEMLPFHVPRAAASTLVLVSFALLLTARGLRRGQRLAWGATLALLLVSATLNIVKGLDFEEAALALAAALWLAPHRGAFPVLPSSFAVRRAVVLGVGGTVGALLLGTGMSMAFGHRQHPRLGESARAVAERLGGNSLLPLPGVGHFVTPALVAVGVGIVISTLWVLLSPRQGRHLTGAAHVAERERARAVVAAHGGGTLDYFALRDDKDWFFAGRSVVAHSVRRGVCLVSPDPIGPTDERELVWDEFMAYAERGGWSIAVIGACEEWLGVYEASGLRPVYVGDEAVVDCATFSLDGRSMKSLRGAYGRVRRAGFTASFVNPCDLGPDERA